MTLKELNTKAWEIRREAANRLGCKVMEVSWRECLILAKKELNKPIIITPTKPIVTLKGLFNAFQFTLVIITLFCIYSFHIPLAFAFISAIMGFSSFCAHCFTAHAFVYAGLFGIIIHGSVLICHGHIIKMDRIR